MDVKLNRIERVMFFLVCAAFFMPILPSIARNVIIAALLVVTTGSFFYKKNSVKPDVKIIIYGSLLYATYLISIFYTSDLNIGLKKLETASSLLVMPFIFGLIPQNVSLKLKENLESLLLAFIFSTALSFVAFWTYFWGQYQMSLFTHFPTVIDEHLGYYRIHAIYICMHGAIALLFSLYLLSKAKKSIYRILFLIVADATILFFLLILVKKGPILSLIISGGYLAFAYRNKLILAALGVLCVTVMIVITFNPKANEKFSELLKIGEKNNTELTSTNIRLSIYSCAKSAIPDAGFFGYGIGDSKKVLIDCYAAHNQELVDREYNSHNQYLSIILKTGYLGLLAFLIYIAFIIFSAYRKKGYLTVAVLLFYLLVMFSENILERENGVVYFSFFVLFFYTTQKIESTQKRLND